MGITLWKASRGWRTAAGLFIAARLLNPATSFAAPTAPAPGTILQQTLPSAALPRAPGSVLLLPAPQQQTGASGVTIRVRKIIISGNALIPASELLPLVAGLQGRADTLGAIRQGAERITERYRAHGYPLAYAFVPAQTIRDGVVVIAVVEPRYDRIDLKMASRLRSGQARKTLGLMSGQPVEQAPLERGLLLLNQTPGVRVAGTLVPGSRTGTSTLEARVTDAPLIQASLGVDDYGSNYTGRVRGLAQASMNDAFGCGSQIGANVLRTDGGLLQSEGFSLLSPDIRNGFRLGAYGSHTSYTLGGPFTALRETGLAEQWGLYADMPLILHPGRLLEARLDWLHDRFTQQSTLAGVDDRSHLDVARLSFAGSLADSFGGVSSGNIALGGGGKYLDSAGAKLADAAGPRTAGTFWVAQAELQRVQRVPEGFRLQAALSGQVSSRNLDGNQKFYLGGPDGVMSYAVGEAGGDEGVLARLGLYHALPLPVPGRFDAGVLLQGGEVWLNHTQYVGASPRNREGLAGAGAALDYRFSSLVQLQLDYVHELGHTVPSAGYSQNGEFWASLQLNI